MMPCRSCSGEKLTEDSVPADSHGTLRRITPASVSAGRPQGRSTTPGPSDCDHGASAGGEAGCDSACPDLAPSARLPLSAAPSPRNERRPTATRGPPGFESKDILRQGSGRTFPSLHGHAAASFIAFLQRYRHWLI